AARATGAVAGFAGGRAFEAIDRRADIRGRVGRLGMRAVPFGVGREKFATLAGHAGRQKAKSEARAVKARKGLSAEDQLRYLEAQGKSRNVHERNAAASGKAQFATSGFGMKGLVKREEAKLAGRTDLTDEKKKALAQFMAERQAAQFIKAGKTAAESTGDDAAVEKLSEAVKKNPALAADLGELGEIATGRVEDEKDYLKTKGHSVFQDAGSAFAHMQAAGVFNEDGSENKGSEGYRILQEKGGRRWEYVQEHLKRPLAERKKMLDAMKSGASDEQKKAADAARWRVGMGADGKAFSVNLAQAAPPPPPPKPVKVEVAAALGKKEKIAEAKARAIAVPRGSDDAVAARGDMVKAGAALAAAFPMAAGGAFDNDESRDEYKKFVGNMNSNFAEGKADDLDWVANLDTDSLLANAGGNNEARAEMIAGLDPQAIQAAYTTATSEGRDDVKIKLGQMVDAFENESRRLEKELKKAKVSTEDVAGALAHPGSEQAESLIKQMAGAGIKNPEQVMKSLDKGWKMRGDFGFRAMRSGVARRAATAGRRAAKATGRGGVATGQFAKTQATAAGAGLKEAAAATKKEFKEVAVAAKAGITGAVTATGGAIKAAPGKLNAFRARREATKLEKGLPEFERKLEAKVIAAEQKKAEEEAKKASQDATKT
ncbi:hypothetical protein KKF59_04025, partial [Patescibacteria group bacterium]|nr:hypothetical protein [Patescibacteria group bacterium]